MKQTYYSVNGDGGSYVDIPCTMACRKMKVYECRKSDGSAYAPQGLRYKLYRDPTGVPYATVFYGVPGDTIPIGDEVAEGAGYDQLVGMPAQNAPSGNYAGGTTYAKGNTVLYNGIGYTSLAAGNIGHQPDISPTFWYPIFNYRAADVPVKVLSDSANDTQVLVEEVD